MATHDAISVADLRTDLGDVLSRAHYQGEVITIAKRDKPFAIVASVDAGRRLSRINQYAKEMHTEDDDALDRLGSYKDAMDQFADQINIDRDDLVGQLTTALSDPKKRSALQEIIGIKNSD